MYRLSKIDDRCHDVSTFKDRCVDLRRSMCWPSKIDVSTFGDRCVDLRRSMIDGRCVGLRRSMVDVKLGCYTCSKHWYYIYISCMRITPRVCTSVLSLQLIIADYSWLQLIIFIILRMRSACAEAWQEHLIENHRQLRLGSVEEIFDNLISGSPAIFQTGKILFSLPSPLS